jgi:FkbM family methyltransferase
LIQDIRRRHPFRISKVPWLGRVYAYPFEHYHSLGRQALFGAPNFFLFWLLQKLPFVSAKGRVTLSVGNAEKEIQFNGKNTQFSAVYQKTFAMGYEAHITALVDLVTTHDSVFYDIGSNWGWFSVFLASKPGFKGKIHAFEPFASSYADLVSVVTQAGFEATIKCHNVALSEKRGTVTMSLPDWFQSGQAVMKAAQHAKGWTVPTLSLDELDLDPPTFIKMDVEGSEMKVLLGGCRLLAKHKPMIVFENARKRDEPMRTLEPLLQLQSIGYLLFHVAWLRKTGAIEFFMGDDADPNPQQNETLALVEFEPTTRFLKPEGMNIFACHRDQYEILARTFKTRQ